MDALEKNKSGGFMKAAPSSLLFDEDGNFMMADVAFPITYESPPHSGWHYTFSPFSLTKTPAMQSNPFCMLLLC
jgi:hypothetical protein